MPTTKKFGLLGKMLEKKKFIKDDIKDEDFLKNNYSQ
jgi:hypothetical protein